MVDGDKSLARTPRVEGMLPQVAVIPSTVETRDESLFEIIWRQRRTVAVTAAICVILCLVYLVVATPKYSTTARIYVQQSSPSLLGEGDRSDNRSEYYLNTQAEMVRSAPVLALALAQPGMEDLRLFDGVRNRISYLKKHLQAEVGRKDDIMTVSLESAYPDEAVRVVSEVVDAFISYQSQETSTTASNMLAVLMKEKHKRELELQERQLEIRKLQRGNPELAYDSNRDGVNQRLVKLNESLTEAHLRTISAQAAYEEAIRGLGLSEKDLEGTTVVSLSAADEERLRAELFAMQQRLAELRRQYMDGHPLVVSAERRVVQLQLAVVAALRQRWVASRQHEDALARSIADEQQRAITTNTVSAEYARLQGELTRLQASRDSLDARIKELSVIESSSAFNIRVVEGAISSDDPVKPQKARYAAGALLAGLILGAGLGLLREWLDPRLHSVEDMKGALGLSVLGVIPRMPSGRTAEANGWIVHLDPMSEAAEACRAIRTAVMFGASGGRAKTILVTSPSAQDGKSTVASNLAIALAKAGKRVLIVDTNFRSPGLHRIFGVSDELGISGVIEQAYEINTAVRQTAIERLDVLPCGESTQDPSELLNNVGFANVLEGLAMAYDHVVLDSPAVCSVDDARIVAASCDVTLLVMRAEKSNRRMAEETRDGLLNVGANLLGIVVNDMPSRVPRGLLRLPERAGAHAAIEQLESQPDVQPQSNMRSSSQVRAGISRPAWDGGPLIEAKP